MRRTDINCCARRSSCLLKERSCAVASMYLADLCGVVWRGVVWCGGVGGEGGCV